jgi:hypothetical protein
MIDTGHLGAEATQPITAIVTNAQAARRFLNRRPSDLDEVRQTLDCIVRDAYRASDLIYRIIRAGFLKEVPPNALPTTSAGRFSAFGPRGISLDPWRYR